MSKAKSPGMCVDCGVAPRPRRTNWDKMSPERAMDADPHHHRCADCYRKWNDRRQARDDAWRRAMIVAECRQTPSRRTVTARKKHRCVLCEGPIEPKTLYHAFTLVGPRTVKVCAGCAETSVNPAA